MDHAIGIAALVALLCWVSLFYLSSTHRLRFRTVNVSRNRSSEMELTACVWSIREASPAEKWARRWSRWLLREGRLALVKLVRPGLKTRPFDRLVPRGADPERISYGDLGGLIPSQMYFDASEQILLWFPMHKMGVDDKKVAGTYRTSTQVGAPLPVLEVELQAAAFEVAGAMVQRREITHEPGAFTWNITPKAAGDFKIAIVSRVLAHRSVALQEDVFTHTIRVVKLASLTARQLQLISGSFAVLLAILGLVKLLGEVGLIDLGKGSKPAPKPAVTSPVNVS